MVYLLTGEGTKNERCWHDYEMLRGELHLNTKISMLASRRKIIRFMYVLTEMSDLTLVLSSLFFFYVTWFTKGGDYHPLHPLMNQGWRFFWFKKKIEKSDLFDLNQIFWFKLIFLIFFLSNHPTPLEVNQSNSAQHLRVANSNYAFKIKQIYLYSNKRNRRGKISNKLCGNQR